MDAPLNPADHFAHLLQTKGLAPALCYLNATTDQRFTGIYRFEGTRLHNVGLCDRESPAVATAADVDASVSYCSLMRTSGKPLAIADTQRDHRVADHPSRDAVRSYCGVPLIDPDGAVLGSLCHFSIEPALVYDEDLELLLQIPPALQRLGLDMASLARWDEQPAD